MGPARYYTLQQLKAYKQIIGPSNILHAATAQSIAVTYKRIIGPGNILHAATAHSYKRCTPSYKRCTPSQLPFQLVRYWKTGSKSALSSHFFMWWVSFGWLASSAKAADSCRICWACLRTGASCLLLSRASARSNLGWDELREELVDVAEIFAPKMEPFVLETIRTPNGHTRVTSHRMI